MVHWVVNTSLHREGGYHNLIAALDRLEVPYTLVDKPPFVDYLIDSTDRKFGEDVKKITLDLKGPVFVTGTTSMRDVSRNHGWDPGYIDAPSQTELVQHWGEHVLNHDSVFGTLEEIQVPGKSFFIRPVEDTKSFAGTIMDADAFEDWRCDILADRNAFVTLKAEDEIMMSPVKQIYAEYRLYFIGGKFVTGSRYKLGHHVSYDEHVDVNALRYAEERIAEYCPRRAVCLDIAHVAGPEPYKVIETNSISSAGFYACDMNKFVGAIGMEFGN